MVQLPLTNRSISGIKLEYNKVSISLALKRSKWVHYDQDITFILHPLSSRSFKLILATVYKQLTLISFSFVRCKTNIPRLELLEIH